MGTTAIYAAPQAQPARRTDTRNPAYRQFVLAYRLLQHDENALAIHAFDRYLEAYPDDPWQGDALFYRALLARRMDLPEEAESFVTRVRLTVVAPEYAVYLLRGQLHIDAGRYSEAVRVLGTAQPTGLPPGSNAAVSYLRAVAYRGVKDRQTAAKYYQQAAALPSQIQGRALIELAVLQDELGQTGAALSTLARCRKLDDPDITLTATLMSGHISYNRRKIDKAIGYYKSALAEHPNPIEHGKAVVGLMMCLLESGEHEQATTTFRRYRSELDDAALARVSYLVAVAHQALGQHDRAIGLLRGLLPKSYGLEIHDRVLFRLALSWFRKAEHGRCLDMLGMLAKQHPKSPLRPHAQFLGAAASLELGELDTAMRELTSIIASAGRHPYYAQALLQRARIYRKKGELERTADDYQAYLDNQGFGQQGRRKGGRGDNPITPPARQAFVRLLETYHRLGRFPQLIALAGQWLDNKRLDPITEQQALYRCALGLIQLGRRPDALASLDRLLSQYPQNTYRTQALYYRGLLHLALNSPDKGLADLIASVDNETGAPLPIDSTCKVLGLIAGYYRRIGSDDLAAKTLIRLRDAGGQQRVPDDDQLWLARYFIGHANPRGALDGLNVLIDPRHEAKTPLRAEALLLRGRALAELDKAADAIKSFREAIETGDAVRTEAQLALGEALTESGRPDEALAVFEPLTDADDQRAAAQALFSSGLIFKEKALAHRSNGREEDAQRAVREAAMHFKRLTLMLDAEAVSPLSELSFIELAEMYVEAQDPQRAIAELEDLRHQSADTSPYAQFAQAMIAALEERAGDALMHLHGLRQQTLDPRLMLKVERLLNRWQIGNNEDGGS